MIYEISNVSTDTNFKFDDEIIGEYTKAIYTHDTDEGRMFLLFHLIDGKWEAQPFYAIGINMVFNMIKRRDAKLKK
ncbi:hypothetical protein DSECCO2_119950 [anaerobic digester metagenome]